MFFVAVGVAISSNVSRVGRPAKRRSFSETAAGGVWGRVPARAEIAGEARQWGWSMVAAPPPYTLHALREAWQILVDHGAHCRPDYERTKICQCQDGTVPRACHHVKLESAWSISAIVLTTNEPHVRPGTHRMPRVEAVISDNYSCRGNRREAGQTYAFHIRAFDGRASEGQPLF